MATGKFTSGKFLEIRLSAVLRHEMNAKGMAQGRARISIGQSLPAWKNGRSSHTEE